MASIPYDIEVMQLNANSRRRRSLAKQDRDRRMNRILRAPAALGLAVLIYFVQLPFPVEQWYFGVLAIALIVPYLARRMT